MSDDDRDNMSAFEGRLSTVEANYNRLHEDVQNLTRNLNVGLDGIREQISRAFASRDKDRKLQMGPVISGISVIITIMVLAFTPLIYGFQMQQGQLLKHDDRLDGRGQLLGTLTNEVARLKEDVHRQDVILQREMRLLDDKTATELDGVIEAIRMEMTLRDKIKKEHYEPAR